MFKEKNKAVLMPEVKVATKALIEYNNKFLVLKAKVNDTIYWDVPGGKIHYGEEPLETLHRECKEEVDMKVEVIKPIGTYIFFRMTDKKQVVCITYHCKTENQKVDLTKNPVENEDIQEYYWLTKEEFLAKEGIEPGLRKLVEEQF